MTARMPITSLLGKDLREVVWCYTKETCSTVFDLRVGDVGHDILYIGIGTLKVVEEEDGNEEIKKEAKCFCLKLR